MRCERTKYDKQSCDNDAVCQVLVGWSGMVEGMTANLYVPPRIICWMCNECQSQLYHEHSRFFAARISPQPTTVT